MSAEIRIKELIGRGAVEEAFARFDEFVEQCREARQELLLLRNRHYQLQEKVRADVIGEEGNLESNRINFSLLEQISSFRREVIARYFEVDDIEQYLNKFTSRDELIEKTLELRLHNKHFRWEQKLAEGNSSAVYRLLNPFTNRHAVGMVLKIDALEEEQKQKIRQLSGLRHRNVIKLLDHELDIYPFLIVMDFVHGPTLNEAIEKTGPRPVAQAVDWLYQITDATDYMRHKRVVQTNLRPSNIYVDDEWQIMLSPFDLHQNITEKHSYSRYLDVCRYGSPEFLRSDSREQASLLPATSDQFSIGLIAYKLLTGEDLFRGDTVYEVLEERRKLSKNMTYRQEMLDRLPKDTFLHPDGSHCSLADLVRRLLSGRPADRYPSLHELLRELHLLSRADSPNGHPARRSYRRCLALNRNLIHDFYENLERHLPEAKAAFSATDRNKQSVMLQMAMDILLDIDEKKELLQTLMRGPRHAGYQQHYFEKFLDALLETLRRNDPQWDEATEDDWAGIREQAMGVIGGS